MSPRLLGTRRPHDPTPPRRSARPTGPWSDLLGELLGPRLPSQPACAGQAPLFDDEVPGELDTARDDRHRRALRICSGCPALDACRELLPTLPEGARGVWAGEVRAGRRRVTA